MPSKTVWRICPVPPKSATFFGQKIVEKFLKVSFSICFNKRLTYISTQVVHSTSSSTQPFFRVTNLQGGWTFGFLSLFYSIAKWTLLFWFFFLKKMQHFYFTFTTGLTIIALETFWRLSDLTYAAVI